MFVRMGSTRGGSLPSAAETARRSTEEKLEEIQDLISENGDVPGVDADGSEPPRVLPMRTNMGVPITPGIEDRVAAVAHLLT